MTLTATLIRAAAVAAVIAAAGCKSAPATPAPATPSAATPPVLTAPVALFNGKDTSGWVQVLDSKWTVEEGVLLARQDPKGRRGGESWLITEKDFTDFLLAVKFRVTAGGNSGVFLRDPFTRADRLAAPDGGNPGPWESGIEANINAVDPEYPTGSIWAIAKGTKGVEHAGDWNDMVIEVRGDKVSTWVNGQPAVSNATQTRTQRGGIGLQRHGTPAYADKLVEFKQIDIQEL
jgi:3-keto-disaccharide hydrolase